MLVVHMRAVGLLSNSVARRAVFRVPFENSIQGPKTRANAQKVERGVSNKTFQFVCDDIQPTDKVRLDVYLSERSVEASRAHIQQTIKNGFVDVNGKTLKKPSHCVKPGDEISYQLMQRRPVQVIAEDIPIGILYSDDDIVVVNKPAGMVVHPSAGHWSGTLVNALMHHLNVPAWDLNDQIEMPLSFDGLKGESGAASGQLPSDYLNDDVDDPDLDAFSNATQNATSQDFDGDAQVFRPGIVHRLDMGTSGVMVVAKNDFAHAHLSDQFKERTANRVYLSIVIGVPKSAKGRITTNIARDPKNRNVMTWFGYHSDKGRTSASFYQTVEELAGGRASLVAWKLETGRTHQIRVHAKYIDHPVFGDDAYGGSGSVALSTLADTMEQRQEIQDMIGELGHPALHAASLEFEHPAKKNRMSFEADLPSDFRKCLEALRQWEPSSA